MATNEREMWLGQVTESILEPDLPIVDPHHHLWDFPTSRYLLDELLRDTGSGHRVIATVFVECGSMYRGDGPRALKPVGETEFVNGIAAQSASGRYGDTRACLGIVSFAYLSLGAEVEAVLQAHIAASPRFRGIRHAAAFDKSSDIRRSHTSPPPDLYAETSFREGFKRADEELILSIYDCAFADMSFGLPSFYDSDAKDVLRARLRRLFRDYRAEMAVIIIDIVLNGEKALDWGWHVLNLTHRQSGLKHEVRTRYFETWRRDSERGWLITSFIDNLDETPRLPEEVICEIQHTDCETRVIRLPLDGSQFSATRR